MYEFISSRKSFGDRVSSFYYVFAVNVKYVNLIWFTVGYCCFYHEMPNREGVRHM